MLFLLFVFVSLLPFGLAVSSSESTQPSSMDSFMLLDSEKGSKPQSKRQKYKVMRRKQRRRSMILDNPWSISSSQPPSSEHSSN